MEKDFRYLIYLAELGKGNIHPLGDAGTDCLIESLRIENENKLLEIGCGTGETMVRILSRYNVTIDGVDILTEMLEKAKLRLKITGLKNRGKLISALPDNSLPFESGSYDRIYSESVLGFLSEAEVKKMAGEIHRVLKKGGIFAANDAVWKKNTPDDVIEQVNKSSLDDFGLTQASPVKYNTDDWNKLYNEAGFEILSCELLSNLIKRKSVKRLKKNIKIYLSKFITYYYSLKGILYPTIRYKTKHYKELLAKHSEDGNYIESRLFLLKKNN